MTEMSGAEIYAATFVDNVETLTQHGKDGMIQTRIAATTRTESAANVLLLGSVMTMVGGKDAVIRRITYACRNVDFKTGLVSWAASARIYFWDRPGEIKIMKTESANMGFFGAGAPTEDVTALETWAPPITPDGLVLAEKNSLSGSAVVTLMGSWAQA